MDLSSYLAQERGRVQRLASALHVSGSLVSQWTTGKPISVERCVPIERATDGFVRRWDLRPDDWYLIWPELIGSADAPALQPATADNDKHAA